MHWFVLLVLVLTAYRATRLVTRDTFPPVLWLRDTVAGGWRPLTEKDHKEPVQTRTWKTTEHDGRQLRWVERASWSPSWLAELITCPWCASAYVSGALTAVTDVTYGLPVPWLVGPAVWAGAALLASKEWA